MFVRWRTGRADGGAELAGVLGESAASRHRCPARLHAEVLGWRLPAPLSRAVAFVDGSSFLVCGGLLDGDRSTAQVMQVSPAGGIVRPVGTLALAVHDAAGATLAGQRLVVGGGGAHEVATVQTCPTSGRGRTIGQLPTPSSDLVTVTSAAHSAYVVGGYDGQTAQANVLATADGVRFRVAGRLRVGVRYAAAVLGPSVLWVLGGDVARRATATVQRVDLRTGAVSVGPSLPMPLSHASVIYLGGAPYLVGGRTRDGAATATVWRIDPATGRLTRAGQLPAPVADAAAVSFGDTAYLIGGEGSRRVATVVRLRF